MSAVPSHPGVPPATASAAQRSHPARKGSVVATTGSARGLAWPAKLVLVTMMLPAYFEVAGILLSLSRILFLVLVPVLFIRLLKGCYGRVTSVDWLLLAHLGWIVISVAINDPEVLVTFIGSTTLISLGGYLTARAYVRSPSDFAGFAKTLGILVLLSLPFAIYETKTSQMIVPGLIEKITPFLSNSDVNYEPRHGFHRVQFVFSHPIHYGLWAGIGFSLVFVGLRWRLSRITRMLWSAGIGFATFLSLSSGPFLAMMVQLALGVFAWFVRGMRAAWWKLLGVSVISYVILDLLSTRPAYYAIVERLAFNSNTANVRRILLNAGVAQIERTPLFGIGFTYGDWGLPEYMTGSLDNQWLAWALLYGLPALASLFAAFVTGLVLAGRRHFAPRSEIADMRLGWALVCFGLMLAIATVAIWNELMTMTYMMLGLGGWFLDTHEKSEASAHTDKAPEFRSCYSRFAGSSEPPPVRRSASSRVLPRARPEPAQRRTR